MLNQTYSKTNFIKSHSNIGFDIDLLEEMSYKKDEIYYTKDGDLELDHEVIIKSKNLFSVYNDNIYSLYLEISDLIKEACRVYEIDKNKQKYMIYAKISQYGPGTNPNWYDFPGINIPYLHGMYFPAGTEYSLSFMNNGIYTKEIFNKNDMYINKPTDVINIKTDSWNDVIEFYVVPLYSLKHNEPGVWVPIN
jgi:hypothetical protein